MRKETHIVIFDTAETRTLRWGDFHESRDKLVVQGGHPVRIEKEDKNIQLVVGDTDARARVLRYSPYAVTFVGRAFDRELQYELIMRLAVQ